MRKIHQPSPEIPPVALPRQTTCVAAHRSELWTLLCPKVMQLTEKHTTEEEWGGSLQWSKSQDRHAYVFFLFYIWLYLFILCAIAPQQQPITTRRSNALTVWWPQMWWYSAVHKNSQISMSNPNQSCDQLHRLTFGSNTVVKNTLTACHQNKLIAEIKCN